VAIDYREYMDYKEYVAIDYKEIAMLAELSIIPASAILP